MKKISHAVQKIVKPVVQALKKSGPYIGAAVGAAVGGFFGGPAGAFAGAKLGYTVGSVAQTVLNSCIPKNTLRIKCDAKKLGIGAARLGVGYVFGKVTKLNSWSPFKKI